MKESMLDLHALMDCLSDDRPLFHLEADFQHSLAWTLHTRFPAAVVRLEYPSPLGSGTAHIDLLATIGKERHVIELKYKTSAFRGPVKGEEFFLKNQAAQDIGRYDILKDLARVEHMASRDAARTGWIIFLTNDATYWNAPRTDKPADALFRIHQGAELCGVRSWGAETGGGTMKGREAGIRLRGRYVCEWCDYSKVGDGRNSLFRYLLIATKRA